MLQTRLAYRCLVPGWQGETGVDLVEGQVLGLTKGLGLGWQMVDDGGRGQDRLVKIAILGDITSLELVMARWEALTGKTGELYWEVV